VFDEGDEHNQRIQDFERRGLEWLRHEFGDDVVYARADHDEAAGLSMKREERSTPWTTRWDSVAGA